MRFEIVTHFTEKLKLTRDSRNIRSETAIERNLWRPLVVHHNTRSVNADGFHEWKIRAKVISNLPLHGKRQKDVLFCSPMVALGQSGNGAVQDSRHFNN